ATAPRNLSTSVILASSSFLRPFGAFHRSVTFLIGRTACANLNGRFLLRPLSARIVAAPIAGVLV
ncbi:MAG TPA: hypothetical protein VFQ42_14980, partial [Mycobacterium sp.]|nr:hypothetical protein [Mycobacterium sp.]